MLIYIEDYLNRHRRSRPRAQSLLVAMGGTASAPVAPASARWPAPVHAVLISSPDLPAASELADLFAAASLIY